MKIGFLFNHDAGHQAGHLLPTLNAYAALRPGDGVCAYVGGPAMAATVKAGLAPAVAGAVSVIELPLPPGVRALARALDPAVPASRVARLRFNAEKFRDLNALVAPERTCLLLKDRIGRDGVKFVHVRHGAGDRAIGFHPSFARFDLLLLQGDKYIRRLRESGGLSGNAHALIGYPKFDNVDRTAAPRKFFDNENPTVIYNPHFSPEFSSWNRMGEAVLSYFADNPDLNLIFAPHVMLFRRRLHLSPNRLRAEWRKNIPEKYNQYTNILIDIDSPRLFDMSYTLSADLYLGDISSQVMEFLVRPRPCVFLNAHGIDWRGRDDFAAWKLGRVVDDVSVLGPALRGALAHTDEYAAAQEAHFKDTFDLTDEPSSVRAAKAIVDFLEKSARAADRVDGAPKEPVRQQAPAA